jgi:uncharacterized protein YjdB
VRLVARYYVDERVDSSYAITWQSIDASVADVSSQGTVRGRRKGQTRITANAGGAADTAVTGVVDVPPAAVATVTVQPASVSLDTGKTTQLVAVVKDAAGATLTGRVVSWTSADTAVARVAVDGVVRGVRAGTVTITASAEGKSGTSTVSVTAPPTPVATVTVQPATASVDTGKTVQLTVVLRDAAGGTLTGRTVTWSSSSAAATVSSGGLVSGVAAGSATITASSEGKSGTATITVNAPPAPPAPVASVTVQPSIATLNTGSGLQLSAVLKDAAGGTLTGRQVTWSSSNSGVVGVSANGLATGIAAGTATVTATSEGQSGGATITVNAPPPTSGSIADPSLLPIANRQLPAFETYTGRSLPAGGSYTDPATGVRVWKATSATTPVANTVGTHDYASGAVQVSREWSGNRHTILANINGGHYLVDFTRGSGFSNWRPTPAVTADLSFTFAQHPADPQIAYYVNGTTLSRYDTRTNAAAPAGHFPKSFASVTATPLTWLQQDKNDEWFVMMPTDQSLVIAWNSVTDVTQVIRPGALDEPHLDKDGRYLALLTGAVAPDWRIYDLQTQTLGPLISKQAHLEALRSYFVSVNPDIASGPQYYYEPATGRQVSTLTASQLSPDGQHRSGQWAQPDAQLPGGSLLKQWYLFSGYEDGVVNASGWTLQSGQIYWTTPNYAPAFQKPTIGVQSVRQLVSGNPAQVARQLTKAASVATMTEGSFFFDATASRVYVWQVGGGVPSTSTVELRAPGTVHDGIGFVRVDGSEVRLLAHSYSHKPAQYWDAPRATVSADGKIVLFSSNQNSSGTRTDLFVVEVPLR